MRDNFFHENYFIYLERIFLIVLNFYHVQVLVNFSEELDDEGIDATIFGQGSRNSMPNMYSSMDTIYMDTFWMCRLIRSQTLKKAL